MYRYQAIILFCMIAGTHAHHAIDVAYDRSNLIEIHGTIISTFWRNPHVVFELETENNEIWIIESGSINSLNRAGFTNELLANGDSVIFFGAPARNGDHAMAAFTLVIDDQTVPVWPQRAIEIGVNVRDLAREDSNRINIEIAKNIFKVWSRSQRLTKDIFLNPNALSSKEAWDPLIDDPALNCIPPGMPSMMDNPYPIAFFEGEQFLTLRLEEWDADRIIWLQEPETITSNIHGVSKGQWVANNLVVTTTDITYPFFDDLGTPLGSDARVIESFRPSSDYTTLYYQAVIYNPEYFNEPAVFKGQWEYVETESIKPFECTLRN